jgi:uncharacterized protein (TIGR03435 family)
VSRLMLIAVAIACCRAQQPEFESASVKPASPMKGNSYTIQMGGDSSVQNFTNVIFENLLEHAYSVKRYQVIGPDWIDTATFDIVARMPAGATEKQVPIMLQKLLVDRFHLKAHRQTKDLPVYLLTVAKGGVKAHPADPKDAAGMRESSVGTGSVDLPGRNMTTEALVEVLSHVVDRPLVDRTGLAEEFAFKMRWHSGDELSLFDAIRQNLGLKVDSGKAPIEVLVIEHVDRVPVEN